jgi:lactoylglutathione lyase
VAFWEKVLGFRVERRFSPRPGMEIAFLADGSGGRVEFIEEADKPAYSGSGISVGFRVPDAAQAAAFLAAQGVEIAYGPIAMPSGVKLLGARDPNGLELGFVEEAR